MAKDWQSAFQTGTSHLSPATITLLQAMEDSIAAAAGSDTEYALLSGTAGGATTLTLTRLPSAPVAAQAWVIVGVYTSSAELRKVSSVVSSTLTLTSALSNAHSANDLVMVVTGGSVSTPQWACKGDGSTDDHDALQAAITAAATAQLWLDGQGRTHITSSPLIFPANHLIKNITIKAKSSFAPADSNGAMAMTQSGNIVAVASADPATDIITTSTAHAIPGDGIGVVFQGASLPTGLVAGRLYYAYNRTTFTFTVSDTVGGGITDITATGTGTAYCEVYASNAKSHLRFMLLECNLVSGLNGILASVQQQTQWDKLRVNNGASGITTKGQQADWRNIEVINCTDSIVFDNMSFLYVKDVNCEQFSATAFKSQNGLVTSHLLGIHLESRDSAGVYCDFATSYASNCIFDDINMSGFGTDTSAWVGFDFNSSQNSYTIRRLRFPQGTSSAPSAIAVQDTYRGQTAYVWADSSGASANREISEIVAANIPTSGSFTEEYGGTTWWGMGGRRVQIGTQRDAQPTVVIIAGSTQTGDQLVVKDTVGAIQFQITKDAQLKLGGQSKLLSGSGIPGAGLGANGDYYFRVDTPGTANQRLYVKSAGAWTGIV